MGNGVNLGANNNLVSTVDICGQKVLGMSGSLTSYINTGVATPIDNFTKVSNKTPSKKQEKKINFNSVIKGMVVLLGAVSAGCLIFANRNKLFKGDFADKIKKFFNKANETIQEETKLTPKVKPEPPKTVDVEPIKLLEAGGVDLQVQPPKIQDVSDEQRAIKDTIDGAISKTEELKNPQVLCLPEPKGSLVVDEVVSGEERLDNVVPKSTKKELYFDEIHPLIKRNRRKSDSYLAFFKTKLTELKAKIPLMLPCRKARMAKNVSDVSNVDIKDLVLNPKLCMDEQARIYPLRKAESSADFTPVDLLKEKYIKQQKLNKIIEEVKSWKSVSLDNEDFENVLAECKAAMNAPAGEALKILDNPQEKWSEETLAKARLIAKQLQEEYKATLQKLDYRLPESAFEDLEYRYVYQPGDIFRIYDPILQQNIGPRYKMDENLVPRPLMPKRTK